MYIISEILQIVNYSPAKPQNAVLEKKAFCAAFSRKSGKSQVRAGALPVLSRQTIRSMRKLPPSRTTAHRQDTQTGCS